MVKIYLLNRTTKEAGSIKLRFRLIDGRAIDVTYKSELYADIEELKKYDKEGRLRPRITLYDRELCDQISSEITLMRTVYADMKDNGYDISSKMFSQCMLEKKNPSSAARKKGETLTTLFEDYLESARRDGLIGQNRYKHIYVVKAKLSRYLSIIGRTQMTADEFDEKQLMNFRNFIFDEYTYVEQHTQLYEGFTKKNLPVRRLSMNTVASQMKMLQTFFSSLSAKQLNRSPFESIGRERKKAVMKTMYDEPIFLRAAEVQQIMKASVPAIEDIKEAFLLQCAFGCRISDFAELSMDNVSVSEEGIPFIHYLPQKTVEANEDNREVKTPIVRFAFEIIKKTGFNLKIVKNKYGEYGYNAKLKMLLNVCKINRKVSIYNEKTKRNEYSQLWKHASSKLARKTHVDMMSKVQINPYISGLHKAGSSAVHHYTSLELKDLFQLMNFAFEQEDYRVDNNLNIIEK